MDKIKINFIDFWEGFNKVDNYFYNILSTKYSVIIDDNPDIILYSCFGEEYLNYNCKRIFYTGENIRPDFSACDFAFTFDFNTRSNHFRLPLYSLYIDGHKMNNYLLKEKTREELISIWDKKTKFCSMLVSSPKSSFRLDFFKELSQFRKIDSGGKIFNNVGGRVKDKVEFIKKYKFVLAFENSSFPGYTTEKILEPIFVDSIPIYWGNKFIERDFNPKRFINYNDFNSVEDIYKRLIEIENNPNIALDILSEPIYNINKISHLDEKKKVLEIISKIIVADSKPIAKTFLKYVHTLKRLKKKVYKKFIKKKKNSFE
tara:strand:+ start:11411 stop:12358 length:948 start_codon:yes stop_codon:yes gene_type:complete